MGCSRRCWLGYRKSERVEILTRDIADLSNSHSGRDESGVKVGVEVKPKAAVGAGDNS